MATIVQDTFTGTDGSNLSAHVGELGASWAYSNGSGLLLTNAGRVRGSNSGFDTIQSSGVPTGMNYDVSADVVCLTASAGEDALICFRMISTTHMYYVNIVRGSNVILLDYFFGSAAQLASASATLSAGTHNILIKVRWTGSTNTINVYLDYNATPIISVSDASIVTAGVAGLGYFSANNDSETAGTHFDNFQVVDAGGVALLPTPHSENTGTSGDSIAVAGINTAWTAGTPGTPTFTLANSGGAAASLTAQVVADPGHATLTLTAGSTGGTATITDPSTSATTAITIVPPASVAAVPSVVPTGANIVVTVTGTSTSWVGGTTLSLSGGTGASIVSQSISGQVITATINPGTAAATLTLSDSTDALTTTISVLAISTHPNNAAWIYSPLNWDVGSGVAITNCAGAGVRIRFSGTTCIANFDISHVISGAVPIIYARIDRAPWTAYTLSGNAINLTPSALQNRIHLLEIVFRLEWTTVDRWNTPAAGLWFWGLTLDSGATVAAPTRRTKTVVIFGDSISEGRLIDGFSGGDSATDDVTACWSYMQGEGLDAEVGVVACGSLGWSVAGLGNWPALTTSYNLLRSGVSRNYAGTPVDLFIYMHGQNDAVGSLTAAMTTVISALLTSMHASKHLILSPPSGKNGTNLAAGVAAINDARVTYVDTSSWLTLATDTSDNIHPYAEASAGIVAPKVIALASALLAPAGGAAHSRALRRGR